MASIEFLECLVCCEQFNESDRCPRMLSCGHTFCSSCLERLRHGNTIDCPTCKTTVNVTSGVAGLVKNFALLSIVNASPRRSVRESQGEGYSEICSFCDDDKHPATSHCLDCEEDMCADAVRWHYRNKASGDHRIVSLEQLKTNPGLAAISIFCSDHKDCKFRYFDEDCGHLICIDCVALTHKGHNCLSLADAAKKYQQKMEVLVTTASTYVEEFKAAEARVLRGRDNLNNIYREEAIQIQATFRELQVALARREQVLINDLYHANITKDATLTRQRDRLLTFQTNLEGAVNNARSTIQSSGNAEFLVAMSDLETLLEDIKSQQPLETQDDCQFKAVAFNRELLVDVINNTGEVIRCSACATTTKAAGSGLFIAPMGKDSFFTISAHDYQGRLLGVGGDIFVVNLQTDNKKLVKVNLIDQGNGVYQGIYRAPAGTNGHMSLSVVLRGAHIQGSPFLVRVENPPIGEVRCYACGRKIRKMNYYINSNEPFRPEDTMRVRGYSALCVPGCLGYAYEDDWTLVCGPC